MKFRPDRGGAGSVEFFPFREKGTTPSAGVGEAQRINPDEKKFRTPLRRVSLLCGFGGSAAFNGAGECWQKVRGIGHVRACLC
jgi:hypothetical protein